MFAPVQLKGLIEASQRLMELLFEVVGPDGCRWALGSSAIGRRWVETVGKDSQVFCDYAARYAERLVLLRHCRGVDPAFAQQLDTFRVASVRKLDLESLLIMPVQRVPRCAQRALPTPWGMFLSGVSAVDIGCCCRSC